MLCLSKKKCFIPDRNYLIIYSGLCCRRFSAYLFMLWRNDRGDAWSTDLWAVLIRASDNLRNMKPRTTRTRWENGNDFWSVSCHESHLSHETYEGCLCYFVYTIAGAVASDLPGFYSGFCIMNHINGHDIVSPNRCNTHHRESNVSWENTSLWMNWLSQTDCIHNSPGANAFSRASLEPYLQHQKQNSYNSIYGVHMSTGRFTFKAQRVWMKGRSTMAACSSTHKELHFNSLHRRAQMHFY